MPELIEERKSLISAFVFNRLPYGAWWKKIQPHMNMSIGKVL